VAGERVAAMERLVRELREFYREPQLAPRRVRLRDVVESALTDVRTAAGAAWEAPELSGLDLEVSADLQKIRQVFLNLVKNAWEAMPDGSARRWSVSARVEGTRAAIVVRDSGTGIPPEYLERLFQPFFTTKRERGTGLGLVIVKRIAEAHGAEIAVESAAGQGTAFTLRWPLAK
jgi:signal transduction histidine kinase